MTKQVFSPRQQEFGPKTGFGIKTGPRTHFFGQGHKRRSNLGKPHPKKNHVNLGIAQKGRGRGSKRLPKLFVAVLQ